MSSGGQKYFEKIREKEEDVIWDEENCFLNVPEICKMLHL